MLTPISKIIRKNAENDQYTTNQTTVDAATAQEPSMYDKKDRKTCFSTKKMILTSEKHVEHLFAGRNTQQLMVSD